MRVEGGAAAALARGRERSIVAGLDLSELEEGLDGCVLVCTTELASREAIDRLVDVLSGGGS